MNEAKYGKFLSAVHYYVAFFLLGAFVVSCCMYLFLSVMAREMGITFTEENIQSAAKLTFANVVFLSAVFTGIDAVRRKRMVTRPVQKITTAAGKLMQGDFTARIEPIHGSYAEQNFGQIVDCFNQLAQALAGMESLRTDFLANVSHELKTPLAVIQNYATMLQTPGLEEQTRIEYARAVTDACRRLSNLVSNILKLNKLEHQQLAPARTEYDVSGQLVESLLQYEHVWEKKSIDLETDIPDGVRIQGDEDLLMLVWNNLLSNAFKFTQPGGRVRVCLTENGEEVTVTVSDTGCGMTPEVGSRIFEKFYQGDPSHSTQGNGLGLALVKRVVDMVQGRIRVESVCGKGSTFMVTLPRRYHG